MEQQLGSRYQLGDQLGHGAMGRVFDGTDKEGNRYAFKILRSDLTSDPELVARFLQERSILVGLRHPNLVTVHDLVVEGDTLAIVMDKVSGGDLRKALKEAGTLLPSEVARIGAGVAAALAAVHAAGVVHRDVKPENVLMDESTAPRSPRLTDFGIAKLANSTEAGRSSLIAGTPQYLAPELAAGEDPTPAADLYSLGIVLYELCCCVTPVAGQSMLTVVRWHAELEPGRPDGIPEPLWELIAWLLAKSPRGRPQSAQQVAVLLDALVAQLVDAPMALRLDRPPPGRPIAHQNLTEGIAPELIGGASPFYGLTPPPVGGPVSKPRHRGRRVLITLVVLAALVGAGVLVFRPSASGTASPSAQPTVAISATDDGSPTTATTTTDTTTTVQMTNAPDLVGKSLSDAEGQLPNSVHVTTVDSVDTQHSDGTVIAQDPAAGATLGSSMTLTVARAPVTVYLDSMQPATGGWNGEYHTASLAGKTYTDAVGMQIEACDSGQTIEYNLSKGYRKLVATAGIDDGAADSGLKVQLQLFADGRQIFNQIVSYGAPVALNADVAGVLRLKIQLNPIPDQSCPNDNDFALGTAELLGLPGEVPASATDMTTPTG